METNGNNGKDGELSDTNGKATTFQNNGSAKSVGTYTERKALVQSEKKGSTEKHRKNKEKKKGSSRWQLARQPYIKKTPGPGDKGTEKKRPFGVKRPGHHKSTQRPGHKSTQRPGHKSTPKPGHKSTPKPGHKSTPKPGHKSTPKPGHKSTPKPGHKSTRRPPGQKKPKPVRKAKPDKFSQSHKKSPKNKKKQQGAGAHKISTKKNKPSHGKHKKKGIHGKKPNDTPAFFKKTGGRVSIKNQMTHKDNKRPKMVENAPDSEEHRRLDKGKIRENSKKTKDEKGDTQENDKRLFGRGSREAMGNHLQPHGPRRVSKHQNLYCT